MREDEQKQEKSIYDQPYELVTEAPIHWSVNWGSKCKIGHFVTIDQNCIIGNNVFIGHGTKIREGVVIGDNSIIGHNVVIEAETKIGRHVTIQTQCHLTKYAQIDDRCFFGPKAMCINTNKIVHGREIELNLEGPVFSFGCRIGAGAVIMPGVRIAQECSIGANATVTKDCELPYGVYIGSPAKWVREVKQEERYPAIMVMSSFI